MSYVTVIYSVLLKLLVLSAPKPSEDKWENFPKTISIDLPDSLQNLGNIQSMLMNKQRKRSLIWPGRDGARLWEELPDYAWILIPTACNTCCGLNTGSLTKNNMLKIWPFVGKCYLLLEYDILWKVLRVSPKSPWDLISSILFLLPGSKCEYYPSTHSLPFIFMLFEG